MKPGVSTKVTSGRPKASASCMKRASLSQAGASSAPPRWRGWLAATATARPPMRASAVIDADAEVAPQFEHAAGVHHRVDDARAGRTARCGWPAAPGAAPARRPRLARRPAARPGSSPGSAGRGHRGGLVGHPQVDHAVRRPARRPGRPRRHRTRPRPPPSIIAGPPMPMLALSVAMITSQQPSSAALPAKQRPARCPPPAPGPTAARSAGRWCSAARRW